MSNTQTTKDVGSRHTVEIVDVAFGGDGVARMDGLAVFVPFTMTGETVEIELTKVHARYARGNVVRMVRPAPERTTPRCPVYGECGGCCYQHMTYPAQLRIKEQQVRALFERIGHVHDLQVDPVIPADPPWGYRNRITLHGPGKPAFHGVDTSRKVCIDHCPIAAEPLNHALTQWNGEHPDGLKEDEDLLLRLDGSGAVRVSDMHDNSTVQSRVLNQDFEWPSSSFAQVNQSMADVLARIIIEETVGQRPVHLIDAYAGVGVFGLLCAEHVETVHLIESDPDAMSAARRNAKAMRATNIHFHVARVEKALAKVLREIEPSQTVCILDPPRSGCSKSVLDRIAQSRVKSLLYISCAPDRLARDTRFLLDHGYICKRVRLLDMFPQTAHLEAVGIFVRDKGA